MAYDFSELKNKIKDVENWLSKELSQIRTGRANPSILDDVKIEVYGSMMPISQTATISTEGPQTLRISPWDSANIKPIEKAIVVSGLGLSVAVDDKGLRVSFPQLTTESRNQYIKHARQKSEEAKVTLRHDRNKVNDDLTAKKKGAEMGEDEMMRHKTEMEKLIKDAADRFEKMVEKKEKEILG